MAKTLKDVSEFKVPDTTVKLPTALDNAIVAYAKGMGIAKQSNDARSDANRAWHIEAARAFASTPKLDGADVTLSRYERLGEEIPKNKDKGNFRRMTDQLNTVARAARKDLQRVIDSWPAREPGKAAQLSVAEFYWCCRRINEGSNLDGKELREKAREKGGRAERKAEEEKLRLATGGRAKAEDTGTVHVDKLATKADYGRALRTLVNAIAEKWDDDGVDALRKAVRSFNADQPKGDGTEENGHTAAA